MKLRSETARTLTFLEEAGDWVVSAQMSEAHGIAAQNVNKNLRRLAEHGLAEMQAYINFRTHANRYRITAKGRAALANYLAKKDGKPATTTAAAFIPNSVFDLARTL